MVLKGDFYIKLENVRVYATQDTGYVTCVEVMNAENSKGRCETTTCPMLGFNTLCSLACCAVCFDWKLLDMSRGVQFWCMEADASLSMQDNCHQYI